MAENSLIRGKMVVCGKELCWTECGVVWASLGRDLGNRLDKIVMDGWPCVSSSLSGLPVGSNARCHDPGEETVVHRPQRPPCFLGALWRRTWDTDIPLCSGPCILEALEVRRSPTFVFVLGGSWYL